MEFLHTGSGQPPYEWLSLILRLRVYKCSREALAAMSPVGIMQDLMMLGAESEVRKVKGGGGSSGGGKKLRGLSALRAMVGGKKG